MEALISFTDSPPYSVGIFCKIGARLRTVFVSRCDKYAEECFKLLISVKPWRVQPKNEYILHMTRKRNLGPTRSTRCIGKLCRSRSHPISVTRESQRPAHYSRNLLLRLFRRLRQTARLRIASGACHGAPTWHLGGLGLHPQTFSPNGSMWPGVPCVAGICLVSRFIQD